MVIRIFRDGGPIPNLPSTDRLKINLEDVAHEKIQELVGLIGQSQELCRGYRQLIIKIDRGLDPDLFYLKMSEIVARLPNLEKIHIEASSSNGMDRFFESLAGAHLKKVTIKCENLGRRLYHQEGERDQMAQRSIVAMVRRLPSLSSLKITAGAPFAASLPDLLTAIRERQQSNAVPLKLHLTFYTARIFSRGIHEGPYPPPSPPPQLLPGDIPFVQRTPAYVNDHPGHIQGKYSVLRDAGRDLLLEELVIGSYDTETNRPHATVQCSDIEPATTWAEYIPAHPELHQVHMFGNHTTPEELATILRALEGRRNVRRIGLHICDFPETQLRMIKEFLQSNPHIEEVTFYVKFHTDADNVAHLFKLEHLNAFFASFTPEEPKPIFSLIGAFGFISSTNSEDVRRFYIAAQRGGIAFGKLHLLCYSGRPILSYYASLPRCRSLQVEMKNVDQERLMNLLNRPGLQKLDLYLGTEDHNTDPLSQQIIQNIVTRSNLHDLHLEPPLHHRSEDLAIALFFNRVIDGLVPLESCSESALSAISAILLQKKDQLSEEKRAKTEAFLRDQMNSSNERAAFAASKISLHSHILGETEVADTIVKLIWQTEHREYLDDIACVLFDHTSFIPKEKLLDLLQAIHFLILEPQAPLYLLVQKLFVLYPHLAGEFFGLSERYFNAAFSDAAAIATMLIGLPSEQKEEALLNGLLKLAQGALEGGEMGDLIVLFKKNRFNDLLKIDIERFAQLFFKHFVILEAPNLTQLADLLEMFLGISLAILEEHPEFMEFFPKGAIDGKLQLAREHYVDYGDTFLNGKLLPLMDILLGMIRPKRAIEEVG